MNPNRVFKMPKDLIKNHDNFNASTIGVAAVLYAYMNRHRLFRNSLKNIALLTHRCDGTVSNAIKQLVEAGYIERFETHVYSQEHERVVYGQTVYRILKPADEDYTLIPYAWLQYDLTPCGFQVLLACRMFMIKEPNRAYPSIRKLAALTKVAKSTVCLAKNAIAEVEILLVERCKKENGAYTSNSYHMLKKACHKAAELLSGHHSQSAQAENPLSNPITLWNYYIKPVPKRQ